MSLMTVRVPKYPECWQACGACDQGEVIVDAILVSPGDQVIREQTLVVLETGKVALDIPAPRAGRVLEILVQCGGTVNEDDPLVTLDTCST